MKPHKIRDNLTLLAATHTITSLLGKPSAKIISGITLPNDNVSC
jgi:hypothetical protein